MAARFDQLPTRVALAEIARDFHARGWMAGTAGNLSAVAAGGRESFWITASGQPKGRLDPDDFLLVSIADGAVVEQRRPGAKPSAETCIHQTLYRLFPEVGAVLHVHTVDACLAVARVPAMAEALPLPPLEMLKGLGIWEAAPQAELPLFDNPPEVPEIAEAVAARFAGRPPRVPALMLRGHGVTVWGRTLQEAYNRVEVVEFLMSYVARSVP